MYADLLMGRSLPKPMLTPPCMLICERTGPKITVAILLHKMIPWVLAWLLACLSARCLQSLRLPFDWWCAGTWYAHGTLVAAKVDFYDGHAELYRTGHIKSNSSKTLSLKIQIKYSKLLNMNNHCYHSLSS